MLLLTKCRRNIGSAKADCSGWHDFWCRVVGEGMSKNNSRKLIIQKSLVDVRAVWCFARIIPGVVKGLQGHTLRVFYDFKDMPCTSFILCFHSRRFTRSNVLIICRAWIKPKDQVVWSWNFLVLSPGEIKILYVITFLSWNGINSMLEMVEMHWAWKKAWRISALGLHFLPAICWIMRSEVVTLSDIEVQWAF